MLNQSVFQLINSGNKEKKLGRNEKKFSQKHFLIIVSTYAFFKKYFIMYLLNNKKFLFKKLFEEKNVPSERVKIL